MRDQHNTKTTSMDMSTLIGYACVLTIKQSLEVQMDTLKKAGCHRVLADVVNGAKAGRPDLDKALEYLRDGDMLVVRKIDRLDCSLVHLVQAIDMLHERDVGFRSLTDVGIDTVICNGKLLFSLFATLTEFERDLASERTKTGLAMAKARDRNSGRRATITPEKLAKVHRLMDKKGLTVKETAIVFDVGRPTLYRALNAGYDTLMEDDE